MDFTNAIPAGGAGFGGKPPGGLTAFDDAEPAPEFTPVPPGVYAAAVERGEYTTTKRGDDAYRLRFLIADGPEAGRTVVRTWTFGPRAMPYTKRDLAPFGLTTTARLLAPFPEAGRTYRVRLVVALQRGDDGVERNDIKKIDVLGTDTHPAAAFELPPAARHRRRGDAT
ncbi:hypothetical protein J0H58_33090 [bacterium]|nr:hypothetical protein [bacterium]